MPEGRPRLPRKAPTMAQVAWVLPLENGNWPDRRQPPAVRWATARGASDDEARAVGSLPQTSICACSG